MYALGTTFSSWGATASFIRIVKKYIGHLITILAPYYCVDEKQENNLCRYTIVHTHTVDYLTVSWPKYISCEKFFIIVPLKPLMHGALKTVMYL